MCIGGVGNRLFLLCSIDYIADQGNEEELLMRDFRKDILRAIEL